jgi:hypothetical protein
VVSFGGDTRRVSKSNLVGILAVLLQNEALRISAGLTYALALVDELLRLKVKVNPVSLHDSYDAWREASTTIWCWAPRARPGAASAGRSLVRAEDYTIARMHA